jgi:hypothetical protein
MKDRYKNVIPDPDDLAEREKAAMEWYKEFSKYIGKDDEESIRARRELAEQWLNRHYPLPPRPQK